MHRNNDFYTVQTLHCIPKPKPDPIVGTDFFNTVKLPQCIARESQLVWMWFAATLFSHIRMRPKLQIQISVDCLMARCSADFVDCAGQTFGSACVNGGESLCSSQCSRKVWFGRLPQWSKTLMWDDSCPPWAKQTDSFTKNSAWNLIWRL